MTDYFFSRQLNRDMYQSTGVVYVANDLAGFAGGCTALRAAGGL